MKAKLKFMFTITLTNIFLMTGLMTGCASMTGTTDVDGKIPVVSDTKRSVSETPTATATQNTSQETNYSLPESVFDGYWAVIKPESSQNTVVSLRKADSPNQSNKGQVNTTLYKYSCDADGDYQKTETHKATLLPTKDNMLMAMEGESKPFSTIKVLRISPKKAMVLNQGFLELGNTVALSNGVNFVYIYTNELKPLCAIVNK